MKKMFSAFLMLCLLLSCSCAAFADEPIGSPSASSGVDGYYEDAGNASRYSYHVPLIHASTAVPKPSTPRSLSDSENVWRRSLRTWNRGPLWSLKTEWHSCWSGSQLFLVILSEMDGDCSGAARTYGYDFETGTRVTNEMILARRGQ